MLTMLAINVGLQAINVGFAERQLSGHQKKMTGGGVEGVWQCGGHRFVLHHLASTTCDTCGNILVGGVSKIFFQALGHISVSTMTFIFLFRRFFKGTPLLGSTHPCNTLLGWFMKPAL